MKTMTCSQLGGPFSCDEVFEAETFEKMIEASRNHGLTMAQNNDRVHIEVMTKMRDGMKNQEEMKKWIDQKRDEFDALASD